LWIDLFALVACGVILLVLNFGWPMVETMQLRALLMVLLEGDLKDYSFFD
jgi:hypothetical protein